MHRTFDQQDLEALAILFSEVDQVVTVREAFDLAVRPPRLVILRHDMDHDVENSLRFAELEASLGVTSSYYVLHSDWYWRAPGESRVSPYALRILGRIASLGHEIGLHNNAITVGLLTGEDPVRILDRELTTLRREGFEVTGSVAHGDKLCRVLGYVNDEVFTESTHRPVGVGERRIEYTDPKTSRKHVVVVRPVPMAELGLTYEANLVRNVRYRLSDTGGHWNTSFREIANALVDGAGTLSMLIHPIYWAFGGEIVHPRPPSSVPALRTR
jgi:hypothetical protein